MLTKGLEIKKKKKTLIFSFDTTINVISDYLLNKYLLKIQ